MEWTEDQLAGLRSAAERRGDYEDDHEDQCMARHPGFGCTCEQIQFEERQREVAAEPNPEQLCFAIATNTGTLATRDGRPLWATRQEWETYGADFAGQLIPIHGAPPLGSLSLLANGAPEDIIGRMVKLISALEIGAIRLAERIVTIDQQLAGRVHERELLRRAAALIDPDTTPATYEEEIDWLAKYREVVS